MRLEEQLKVFFVSGQLAESELTSYLSDADPGEALNSSKDKDATYYPQFSEALRNEASEMSKHYELFYCLERSAREIIRDRLFAEKGSSWWESCVPENVKKSAAVNLQREIESGFTQRSVEIIDYTTFGELGEIVRQNWATFSDTFNNEKAFSKVMSSLNMLRGPIAHCCMLAEDEVLRLKIVLKDWFRLME